MRGHDENDCMVVGVREGRAASLRKPGQSLLQQGSKRRAPLGDVSNQLASLASKSNKTGKAAPPGAVKGPATRSSLRAAAEPMEEAAVASTTTMAQDSGPSIRTRAQTKGLSTSAVLQQRSQAAIEGRTTRRSSAAAARLPALKRPASEPLPDIDADDCHNPQSAFTYVNDIHSYFRRAEPKFRPAVDYMKRQVDLNEKMRAILIDWLQEVHLKFKLMPETLFLTVNLIDRFLEKKQVTRRNLQLVGVTAMLIASKYEELWAPEVQDFVYISDKAYTREQILECERLMLNTLNFQLTLPTSYNFACRFLKAAGVHLNKQVPLVAAYLAELALIDAGMLRFSYSLTSAAAVFVSLRAAGVEDPYPHALRCHSGYSREEIMPCAAALVTLMQRAPTSTLTACFKKYSTAKLLEVSKVMQPPLEVIEEARKLSCGP